jgi:hypothetical protein
MNYKDRVLLEQAYQTILEAGMPPTAGAASRAGANPGAAPQGAAAVPQTAAEEPISLEPSEAEAADPNDDPQMQEAMAILNQYAQGDINNLEAAKMFKDLFEKGAGQGPTQDDMYKTTTDSELPKFNSGGLRPAVPKIPGVR